MFKNFKKGVSLYLAIMVMTILLAIGLGISVILIGQIKIIRGMEDSVIALSAADTGIERILYEDKNCRQQTPDGPSECRGDIDDNGYCDGLSYIYSTGGIALDNDAKYIAEVSEPYLYKSKGKFGKTARAIEIFISSYKIVFATKDTYTSDLITEAFNLTGRDFDNGLEAADGICQYLADAVNLPGTYKAWLSTGGGVWGQGPSKRFNRSAFPYRRVDGLLIANNWYDLTDFTLVNPVKLNEFGEEVPHHYYVWTNTDPAGDGTGEDYDCADWTGGGALTAVGDSWEINWKWTTALTLPVWAHCSESHGLYCFQQ